MTVNFREYEALIRSRNFSKDKPFCFVFDCSDAVIGYIYRDCGLGDGFKFAPFSHGLSDLIHGVDFDRTCAVLDAFQLQYSREQLELLVP